MKEFGDDSMEVDPTSEVDQVDQLTSTRVIQEYGELCASAISDGNAGPLAPATTPVERLRGRVDARSGGKV